MIKNLSVVKDDYVDLMTQDFLDILIILCIIFL